MGLTSGQSMLEVGTGNGGSRVREGKDGGRKGERREVRQEKEQGREEEK